MTQLCLFLLELIFQFPKINIAQVVGGVCVCVSLSIHKSRKVTSRSLEGQTSLLDVVPDSLGHRAGGSNSVSCNFC